MRDFGIVLLALSLIAAASPSSASEPERLAPSSKWHVDYAADSCRLARSFGAGDDEVLLLLDRFEPGAAVHVTLSGKLFATQDETKKIVLRFGAEGEELARSFKTATMENGSSAIIIEGAVRPGATGKANDLPTAARDSAEILPTEQESLSRLAAISFLQIVVPERTAIILDLGRFDTAMKGLADCADNLLAGWGVDSAAHANLSRRAMPTANPAQWLPYDDHLVSIAAQGQRAIIHFRLIVDTNGRPVSCHIQQSTRPSRFDDVVCKAFMRRARFTPALDAAGAPIASHYVNRIDFGM